MCLKSLGSDELYHINMPVSCPYTQSSDFSRDTLVGSIIPYFEKESSKFILLEFNFKKFSYVRGAWVA